MTTLSGVLSPYKQTQLLELDPLLKRCLSISGSVGALFLIAVFLTPRQDIEITTIDQVPERFAVGVGLHREEHEVHHPDARGVLLGAHADRHIAQRALHRQAVGADRLEVCAPRDDRDVLARRGEPCAVVPPYRPGSDDRDPHDQLFYLLTTPMLAIVSPLVSDGTARM